MGEPGPIESLAIFDNKGILLTHMIASEVFCYFLCWQTSSLTYVLFYLLNNCFVLFWLGIVVICTEGYYILL